MMWRHFVGQSRTYIRVNDDDPGNIDTDAAAQIGQRARNLSYGLFTTMRVNRSSVRSFNYKNKFVATIRVQGLW